MVFSSISFLCFFLPAVLTAYYVIPFVAWRNAVLLLASLLFYAWGEPTYVFLMIASILFNYNAGLKIAECDRRRGLLLAFSVIVNLAALFVFKYLGYTSHVVGIIARRLGMGAPAEIKLALPLGISFYTFQSISYLVDVWRNPTLVQRDPLRLGLYISLFPQLVAGPIVRYGDIAAQIAERAHNMEGFARGAERFIVGLAKKVLLANTFASVCDTVYSGNMFLQGARFYWLALFSYSMQIYFDFSGYSDMAIGLGRMFGFSLPENFDRPYSASSVTEFWRRWHMTLTGFFRDYIYIPLGGNRKGKVRTALNRLLVFFVTGLWHGAGVGFVLWGLLHGALMTVERLFPKRADKKKGTLARIVGQAYTFASVSLLWLLFRNGFKPSVKILLKMFGVNYTRFTTTPVPFTNHMDGMLALKFLNVQFFVACVVGIAIAFVPHREKSSLMRTVSQSAAFRWAKAAVLLALFVLSYARLAGGSYNPFIYFRF